MSCVRVTLPEASSYFGSLHLHLRDGRHPGVQVQEEISVPDVHLLWQDTSHILTCTNCLLISKAMQLMSPKSVTCTWWATSLLGYLQQTLVAKSLFSPVFETTFHCSQVCTEMILAKRLNRLPALLPFWTGLNHFSVFLHAWFWGSSLMYPDVMEWPGEGSALALHASSDDFCDKQKCGSLFTLEVLCPDLHLCP